MKLTLRDFFWLMLLIGMGLVVYNARRSESRARETLVRTEWKVRVLSEVLRVKGTTVADDGNSFSLDNREGKTEFTSTGFQHWAASGTHSTANFPRAEPYFFPPVRKRQP